MTKETLISKLKEIPNLACRQDIIKMVTELPNPSNIKFIPKDIKKGDVYFCPGLAHHVVVVKMNKSKATCLIITSKGFIPCKSRFITGGFSDSLVGIELSKLSAFPFSGIYGNSRHINESYNIIKNGL